MGRSTIVDYYAAKNTIHISGNPYIDVFGAEFVANKNIIVEEVGIFTPIDNNKIEFFIDNYCLDCDYNIDVHVLSEPDPIVGNILNDGFIEDNAIDLQKLPENVSYGVIVIDPIIGLIKYEELTNINILDIWIDENINKLAENRIYYINLLIDNQIINYKIINNLSQD